MNIEPLGKRITLKPIKEEESDGVYVPEDMKKRLSKGEVVNVGGEVTHVKVGDVVIFSPFHYDEITEDLLICDEQDIWGIVK